MACPQKDTIYRVRVIGTLTSGAGHRTLSIVIGEVKLRSASPLPYSRRLILLIRDIQTNTILLIGRILNLVSLTKTNIMNY